MYFAETSIRLAGTPFILVESFLIEVIYDHCPGVARYRLSL
jgi:hypothetical protein